MNYTANVNEDSHRCYVLALIGRTYTMGSIASKNEYKAIW